MKISIVYWSKVIILGIFLGFSVQLVSAWTEPSANPPGGNVGAPVNTGSTGQWKTGKLGVETGTGYDTGYALSVGSNAGSNDGLKVSGNTYFEQGRVGIGTNNPLYALDVNGGISSGAAFASGDGDVLLNLNSERNWVFKQNGNGAGAALELESVGGGGNKHFLIDTDGRVGIGLGNGDLPNAKTEINGSGYLLTLSGAGTTNYKRYSFYQDAARLRLLRTNDNGSYGRDIISFGGNGRVGIGTLDPQQALDVHGNIRFNGPYFIYNSTNGVINWGSGSSGNLYFRTLSTQGDTSTYSNRMVILNNGNVGIGRTSPGYKLDVNGTVGATSFIYTSDERLKKNIKKLDSSLDRIKQVDGVSFDWRENGNHSIGLIAQNVEKVFPEVVRANEETGMKAVQYGNLVAPIIEAIKELSQKIDDLFATYLDQQVQIDDLNKRIEALENK